MSVKMVNVRPVCIGSSGGNKQKVVLARWIGKDSDIVVLDSPTRGIDIKGKKQDIYQLMNQMRKNGKSIIMISEELMELIGITGSHHDHEGWQDHGESERNEAPRLENNPDYDDGIRRQQWRIKLRQTQTRKSSAAQEIIKNVADPFSTARSRD